MLCQTKAGLEKGVAYVTLTLRRNPSGGYQLQVLPTSQKVCKMYETVISPDVTMTGELISSGDVEVKGNVEGDIQCRNLFIEFGSEVKGTVKAERIIVKGQITGSVNGVKVVLGATAKVYGDLNSTSLFVDEEALFEGSSQRVENPLKNDKAKPTKVAKEKRNNKIVSIAAAAN